jgi:subtilase family serine protease
MFAQGPSAPARGHVIVPTSSIPVPGRPVTDLLIFVPEGAPFAQTDPVPGAETPASLACVYKLTKQVKGCPINGTTAVPTGGAKAIALVDVGDDPNAETELKTFSDQFGLPAADFQRVCVGSGGCSPQGDWQLEEALDIEWAHAMAPKAKIYLVEKADGDQNIFPAEKKASEIVAAAGGGEVSNSWGFVDPSEWPGETQDDVYFRKKGVVYFASSGDSPGVQYPSASPYVVSAGGTKIWRSHETGFFSGETAWGSSGGGPSQYEHRPAYQDIVEKIVGSRRGTPDVSFDADPSSGVAIYSVYGGGWLMVGGTSVSSPSLAGIFNSAGHFYGSTADELTAIYKEYGNPTEYKEWFRDITIGQNKYPCEKGYDFCSGVGTPFTFKGK